MLRYQIADEAIRCRRQKENSMKVKIIPALCVTFFILLTGCNSGIGNPFTGSTWTVGPHTVSFNHATAERDTVNNRLLLKFNLLSNTTYPDAVITVENLTTLAINESREVTVVLQISQGDTYQTDLNAIATITFSQLDFATTGAVSGVLTGELQHVEAPGDAPEITNAEFDDVPVTE